jgi:SAM-dependent methyltransferase
VYGLLERPRAYEILQRLIGSERARRRFVEEILQPFSEARVLDIGCGAGTLLDYLPDGIQYTGIDMNSRYIDSARGAYGERARFVCARVGDEVDVGAATFDFVVAKSVLHHLNDDDANALFALARRSLRTGGVFVSIDPVRHLRQSLVARALMALDRGARVRTSEAYYALLAKHFEHVESRVLTDLLPIPYSHWVARAIR